MMWCDLPDLNCFLVKKIFLILLHVFAIPRIVNDENVAVAEHGSMK